MTYPGGKNGAGVYQTIINVLPPHSVYIEPFLGSGAVMRLKRPAPLNIGVDLDPRAVEAMKYWLQPGTVAAMLAGASFRCPEFNFIVGDGIKFLKSYKFTGAELVYCDPPYLLSARRSSKRLYRHELTDAQHTELLAIVTRLCCRVVISGYHSPLYASKLRGWESLTFDVMTRGGGVATEWLWFNFQRPAELHDYRYVGADYRQRERIKRKRLRWVKRLQAMPDLERQVLLSAISEVWAPSLAAMLPDPVPAETALAAGLAAGVDTRSPKGFDFVMRGGVVTDKRGRGPALRR